MMNINNPNANVWAQATAQQCLHGLTSPTPRTPLEALTAERDRQHAAAKALRAQVAELTAKAVDCDKLVAAYDAAIEAVSVTITPAG